MLFYSLIIGKVTFFYSLGNIQTCLDESLCLFLYFNSPLFLFLFFFAVASLHIYLVIFIFLILYLDSSIYDFWLFLYSIDNFLVIFHFIWDQCYLCCKPQLKISHLVPNLFLHSVDMAENGGLHKGVYFTLYPSAFDTLLNALNQVFFTWIRGISYSHGGRDWVP